MYTFAWMSTPLNFMSRLKCALCEPITSLLVGYCIDIISSGKESYCELVSNGQDIWSRWCIGVPPTTSRKKPSHPCARQERGRPHPSLKRGHRVTVEGGRRMSQLKDNAFNGDQALQVLTHTHR